MLNFNRKQEKWKPKVVSWQRYENILCKEKGPKELRVISIQVTAESPRWVVHIREMRAPKAKPWTLVIVSLVCQSRKEDRPGETGKEPSIIMSWESKSFMTEWVVSNSKCSREVKDNKNKRLLNLIRKRNNTVSVSRYLLALYSLPRLKLLITYLIQFYCSGCLLSSSPGIVFVL